MLLFKEAPSIKQVKRSFNNGSNALKDSPFFNRYY